MSARATTTSVALFLLALLCSMPSGSNAQVYNYINMSLYHNRDCGSSGFMYNDGQYDGPGRGGCTSDAQADWFSYNWDIDTPEAFTVYVFNNSICENPVTAPLRFTHDGECLHVDPALFVGNHFSIRRNFYHPPAPTPAPLPPTPQPTPVPTPVPTGNGNGTLECGNGDCVQQCGTSGGGCFMNYCRDENNGQCTDSCGCPANSENGCGCCAYNPTTTSCSAFVPLAPLVVGDFLSVAGFVRDNVAASYACRTTGLQLDWFAMQALVPSWRQPKHEPHSL